MEILLPAIKWIKDDNTTGIVVGKRYFDENMLRQFSQRGVSTNETKLIRGFVDAENNFFSSREEAIKKTRAKYCSCIIKKEVLKTSFFLFQKKILILLRIFFFFSK